MENYLRINAIRLGETGGTGGSGAAGESKALRAARIVIGNAGAGYTEADCDLLCDGTNDLAQFNAALASLPDTGGEIKVLDGTYVFPSPLVIDKSNVTLSGCGSSNTVLSMIGARTDNDGAADAQTNNAVVYVSGSNNTVERFTLTAGTGSGSGRLYGIYLDGGSDNSVTGNRCSIASAQGKGICLNGGNNHTVAGNTWLGTYNNNFGVYLKNGVGHAVTGNKCYCTGESDGNIYLDSCRNCTVTKNRIYSNAGSYSCRCIYVHNTYDCTITGNLCAATAGGCYGIFLEVSSRNTVTGNVCANIGNYGGFGIQLNSSNSNTITGNTVSNGGANNMNYGIYLNSSHDNAVTGNAVSCTGGDYSGNYGIYVYNSNSNMVTGNLISNSNAASKPVWGVCVYGSSNNVISFVAAGKTATFKGFALYVAGTANGYNRIINCNLRNWAQYGTGVLTTDGTTAATLPGSAMAVEDFSAIGAGSVAGLNTV
jgi:parallel beta-helix repeat protein